MTVSRPEPEWDTYERAIMLAAHELEQDKCPGCGDWLSQTVTDKPPHEDDAPYAHRMHKAWCRTCVAHDRVRDRVAKYDESVKGTRMDEFPSGRRIWFERIPLPPNNEGEG